MAKTDEFQFLHISLLREYLDLVRVGLLLNKRRCAMLLIVI